MSIISPWLIILLLFVVPQMRAGTVIWSGASGTDTNWSNANNWFGGVAPGGGDDVKFFDTGTNLTVGLPNNLVDAGFAGYVGSLQLGQSNGMHTIQISAGQTLNITNSGGLFVGTSGDVGAARVLTNSITGAGATLNVSNAAANLVLNQGQNAANGSRAVLDLSGLDNFTANIFAIGIGSVHFKNAVAQRNSGILFLARTNNLTLNLTNTLANYSTLAAMTNAIEMAYVGAGNNATALSFIYLGQTNSIFADSLGIGKSKASAGSAATLQFNPAFASPSAYFRGVNGSSSRVTWWSIGDMGDSASSAQQSVGTNDFSLGTVDALVETMSLGRDCLPQHTAGGFNIGVLTFTAGTIDVNSLVVGNQALGPNTSIAGNLGIVNANGPAAKLVVNNTLELGHTTVAFVPGVSGTNAAKTYGILNIRNGGTVLASRISVGAASTNNNSITLNSGKLIVSSTIATNSTGLYTLALTNATLGLTVPANGSLRGLVKNLITSGATNLILLDATPVFFGSYPQQFPLIKYTAWTGTNNFGLTNPPAWAAGATLVSNGPNSSLDLSLPSDPRPVITAQPTPYSGNPGDNVTTSFAVTIAPASITPLGYQWYYTNGVSTNLLSNGPGPSGLSALSGATSANLQVANAQPGDSGGYFVVVTNAFGTNTSSQVLLTISAAAIPPGITGPASQTATNGVTTVIANSASGSPVPVVYWQFNGVDLADGSGPSGGSTISGSTTTTLTISHPQYPGDQGTYSLIASNSAGMATNNIVLTVIVPPAITNQPVSVVVTNTQTASFTVVAGGVPAPTYQWSKNGTPISVGVNNTAANATFMIASATSADTANYFCTISNPAGSTNTVSVTLTVNSTMSITATTPSNGQAGVCYDTPLYATFSTAPTLRAGAGVGAIKIYNATNTATPVDTIDLSLGSAQPRSIGGDTFTSYPVIITGSTAAIYPHSGVMKSNQTYYVTIDDGVFADASGAYFAGITSNTAWQFSTKAGGPANLTSLVVAADGSGDFLTVQGAVDAVPANNTTPTVISLRTGFYQEIVDVKSKHNLDFRGQTRTGTFIGYPNNNNLNPGAPQRAMFVLNGNDCSIENLTLTNTTPAGGSQAEAIDVEGTRAIFYNMELDSYQDTFLVHSANKLVYFGNCLVQGQTDFNWGYGTVYYTNCEIRCLVSGGHVTQPRSPQGTNGFGFINCRITKGYSGAATFDLGRTIGTPDSPSEVLFANCLMDDVVTGYASDAGTNMADYACSNLTATVPKVLAFSTHATSSDPYVIAIQSAATWFYGWTPALAPNITGLTGNQNVTHGQSASFTVTATGLPDPTYQWQHAGTNVPGGTSATLTIASAERSDAGNYTVVASNGSGSVTSVVATLTYNNTAPVANPSTYSRPAGYPLVIPITGNLATYWSDADSDPLALTGGISSTNGATVSHDSTSVYYTNANDVADQIDYTVGDGFGGTTAGMINVLVGAPPTNSIAGTVVNGNGTATLNFVGVPGYTYQLDVTMDLTPPVVWTTISTNTADINGLWQFTDDQATNYPNRYYRSAYRP